MGLPEPKTETKVHKIEGWNVQDTESDWFSHTFTDSRGIEQFCSFHNTASNVRDVRAKINYSTADKSYKDVKPTRVDFSDSSAFRNAKDVYKELKKSAIKPKDDLIPKKYNKKYTGLDKSYIGVCVTPDKENILMKMFESSITWEWINETWLMSINESYIKHGVTFLAIDSLGNLMDGEIEWVEVNGTNKFFVNLTNATLPLNSFGYRIYNDYDFYFDEGQLIETHTVIETEFTKTVPKHRVIDFNSFVVKDDNNLTSAKVQAFHNYEVWEGLIQCSATHKLDVIDWYACLQTIRYYDVLFEGEIYNTDPELEIVYDSSTTTIDMQHNQTEVSNLGVAHIKNYSDTVNFTYNHTVGDFKTLVYHNSSGNIWKIEQDITTSDSWETKDLCDSEERCVSYWAFDGNYTDSKGSNDGTPTGSNNATGISSGAINFNGNSDKVTVSSITGMTTSNGTISVWFNRLGDGNVPASAEYIFSDRDYPTTANRYYIFTKNDGTVSCNFNNNANVIGTITDNTWYHAVMTWNTTGFTCYLNNKVGSDYEDQTISQPMEEAGIGHLIGATFYFNGIIDEVLIYNKTLSVQEIDDLHKAGLSQHAVTNITLQSRTADNYNLSGSDLKGLWGLNTNSLGIAVDETGNNDGTWENGVYPLDDSGVVGMGCKFDAVDDYINVSFDASSYSELSISAWIKPDDVDTIQRFVSLKYDSADDIRFWVFNGALKISFDDGTIDDATYNDALSVGLWYHIAATYTDDELLLYLNGVEVASDTSITPFDFSGLDGLLTFGRFGAGSVFNGSLDEVRIYNRSLSSDEVKALYDIDSAHIEWNRWGTESIISTGTIYEQKGVGGFQQYKYLFNSDNQNVSPYLLMHNITLDSFCDYVVNDTCYINTTQTYSSNLSVVDKNKHLIITTNGQIEMLNRFDSLFLDFKTITIEGDSSGLINGSNITIHAENLTIESGGRITATELGYLHSEGPGAGQDQNNYAAGAGHVGYGGNGGMSTTAKGGSPYGSTLEPNTYGSGGGDSNPTLRPGGDGGGIIRLNISNMLEINGTIDSNGGNGSGATNLAAGGGAGGSIWITTHEIKGNGNITAFGGYGHDGGSPSNIYGGGAGSGGAIAIYYNISSFDMSNINASKGIEGETSSAFDYIEDGEHGSAFMYNLETKNMHISTVFKFIGVNTSQNQTTDTDFFNATTKVYDFNLLNITSAHVTGQRKFLINITANNITIDENSVFDLGAKGWGETEGVCPGSEYGSNQCGGGGHGGVGGRPYLINVGYQNTYQGCYNDDPLHPTDFGSGGDDPNNQCTFGTHYNYCHGGGAVNFKVDDTFTLNGIINVSGREGYDIGSVLNYGVGGGAGGSIYINTYNLTGNGLLQGVGGWGGHGAATNYIGGGGAGGIIAIHYNYSDFDNSENISVKGLENSLRGTGLEEHGSNGIAFLYDTTDDVVEIVGGFRLAQNITENHTFYNTDNPYLFDFNSVTMYNSTIFIGDGNYTMITDSLTMNETKFVSRRNGFYSHEVFLNLSTGSDLLIDPLSSIDLSWGGHLKDEGPGIGDASTHAGGGAGHGGLGGDGFYNNPEGGPSYGSQTFPQTFGSGGRTPTSFPSQYGGKGGGIVHLIVDGTLTFEGLINVSAQNGTKNLNRAGGGGSGGSVMVNATLVDGSGTIKALGGTAGNGSGTNFMGGSGAGGRVAVFGTGTFDCDTQINVSAGFEQSPSKGDNATNGSIYCTTGIIYNTISFTEIPTNITQILNESFYLDLNFTNTSGIDNIWINDSRLNINNEGIIKDYYNYTYWFMWVNVSVNLTTGEANSTIFWINYTSYYNAPEINIDIPLNSSYDIEDVDINFTFSVGTPEYFASEITDPLTRGYYNLYGTYNGQSYYSKDNKSMYIYYYDPPSINAYAISKNVGDSPPDFLHIIQNVTVGRYDGYVGGSGTTWVNKSFNCWYKLNDNAPVYLDVCTNTSLTGLQNRQYTINITINQTDGQTDSDIISFTINVSSSDPKVLYRWWNCSIKIAYLDETGGYYSLGNLSSYATMR